MVRVSIRIRNGAAHLDVAVQAENIERAISIVRSRYPTANVEVESTVDPRRLSGEDHGAPAGLNEHDQPEWIAA